MAKFFVYSFGLLLMSSGHCLAQVTFLPAVPASIAIARDASDRMTVAVMINGRGPYAFVVDTAADCTVISQELAATLGLPAGPRVIVNATNGATPESTAQIAELSVGPRTAGHLNAALLPRAALGADGMLGLDTLRNTAMVMNFKTRSLTVTPSHRDPLDAGAIVVEGRNLYGQLILLDAYVGDRRVYVILDSGAQISIGNSTFRRLMVDGQNANSGQRPAEVLSVTGGSTPGQFATLPELTLGEMTVRNMPVAFADLYTFRLLHLDHRPAMLLGMDVLRVFERVEVDYPRRQVRFAQRVTS